MEMQAYFHKGSFVRFQRQSLAATPRNNADYLDLKRQIKDDGAAIRTAGAADVLTLRAGAGADGGVYTAKGEAVQHPEPGSTISKSA